MLKTGSTVGIATLAGLAVSVACTHGGSAGPTAGVLPEQVTLLEVQTSVFSPRCALSGCHVGTTAPFGLDLSSGNSAGNTIGVPSAQVPSLLRVRPFDAANSYLYMKLVADPRILGDPMPAFGEPLNVADLSRVETWIEQGAQ